MTEQSCESDRQPPSNDGPKDKETSGNDWQQQEKPTTIRVGRIKFNGQLKHFAYVPREKLHSRSELQDLMDFWGLSVPSFIIETNFSNRNGQNTITKENVDNLIKRVYPQPFFQYHMEEDKTGAEAKQDPKQHASMSEHVNSEDKEDSKQLPFHDLHEKQKKPRNQSVMTMWRNVRQLPSQVHLEEKEWEEFANTYLHQKLEKSLSAVVSAADMTGGWILCRGPPTTNEKLLEVAIETTRSTQTVLVVDDPENYQNEDLRKLFFKPPTDELDRVKRAPNGVNEFTTDLADALDSSKKPKKVEEFLLNDEYDCQHKRISNPATKGDTVQLWKQENGSWVANFPWKKGNFFLFTDDSENFNADLLGPSGYLAINGYESKEQDTNRETGLSTGHMIRESLSRVRPCLIFDNTGREAQMYAKLIREIIWRDDLKRTLVVLESLIRDAPKYEKKKLKDLRPTNSIVHKKKLGGHRNQRLRTQRAMSAPELQQAADTTTGSEDDSGHNGCDSGPPAQAKPRKYVSWSPGTKTNQPFSIFRPKQSKQREENYKEKSIEFVLYKLNNGIAEYRESERKRRRNGLSSLMNQLSDLFSWILSYCCRCISCRCHYSYNPDDTIDEETYYRDLRMDLKKYAG